MMTEEIITRPCCECGFPRRWHPNDGEDLYPCAVCYDAKYGANTTEKWGTEEEKRRKRELKA